MGKYLFLLAVTSFMFGENSFCQENIFLKRSDYPNLSVQDNKTKYALVEVPTGKTVPSFDLSVYWINWNDKTISATENQVLSFLEIPQHRQFPYLPSYKEYRIYDLQKTIQVGPWRYLGY